MRNILQFSLAVVLSIGIASGSKAAIVGITPDASFASSPYTVSLFDGAATYSFSALQLDPDDILYRQDALTTTGGATAYGGGFIGNGTDYTTYSAGSLTPSNNFGGDFISASSAKAIDYSLTDSFLALSIVDNGLTYYGYAEVDGTSLVSLAYNSVAGGSISTGDAIAAPLPTSSVPEAGTWAMMILGFGAVGGVLRGAHRRSEERSTAKVRAIAVA